MSTNNFLLEFNALSGYLRSFALKLTNDAHAAEDLFQDTALRAFKHQDKFSSDSNLKAWLCTIMKNTFINNFRKKKRRGQILGDTKNLTFMDPESMSARNEGEGNVLIEELQDLIDTLDDNLREPFLMAYQGYKYEEICQHLSLPVGTVKSRIFCARKELKYQIKKLYGNQNAVELAA